MDFAACPLRRGPPLPVSSATTARLRDAVDGGLRGVLHGLVEGQGRGLVTTAAFSSSVVTGVPAASTATTFHPGVPPRPPTAVRTPGMIVEA